MEMREGENLFWGWVYPLRTSGSQDKSRGEAEQSRAEHEDLA